MCRAIVRAAILAACVVLSVSASGVAVAAPPGLVQKCSDPDFRQKNLELCNRQEDPFLIGGGGGGGHCGAICGILKHIPGLGGLGGLL
jgi:hypothetical protein